MKKVFRMKDLDCAHCAAKMERNISKLNGVKECAVNFMMQKLVLEIEDGIDETALFSAIKAEVKKVEPDCEVIGL